jgi:hypothetical protein
MISRATAPPQYAVSQCLDSFPAPGKKKKNPEKRSPFRDFVFAASVFHDRNIRRVYRFHADDMIAAIRVMDFTRHRTGQVRKEIEAHIAHFLNGDSTAQRRVIFIPLEDIAEVTDARSGERLDRAAEIA